MSIKKVSIIGLGLLGGSIAKALKNSNEDFEISAFDKSETLKSAIKEKVIDIELGKIDDALDADVIFISLPVDYSIEIFEQLADKLKSDQILTDVCSVKNPLNDIWNKKPRKGFYIGGHPMTGKEKGGYENSDPLLFENCVYILTDNAKGLPVIESFTNLIHLLGAKITYLNPKVHDIIVASVSHLPQIVSVSLINSASLKDSDLNFFDYAAGGFRDMTRIAASDFRIWEPIIRNNGTNIIQAIDNFILDLEKMKKSIAKEEYEKIADKFEIARIKRDEIPKSSKGFINQIFDLFVFVKDEPGVLSKITTALFEADINIKDLELLKIRVGTGGTFRLAFETKTDVVKARQIIEQLGFSIHG
jgi:prephenate dehydrogenase